MANGKEVATIDTSEYVALSDNAAELQQALAENIGDDQVNEFDIDRVKIPSGGSTTWEVSTLDGEESVKDFSGIIVAWANRRAYWPGKFSGGNEPPQCSSQDGIIGVGDPGGECDSCPLSQFGSDDDEIGQACKAMRLLFMLQPHAMLPTVVTLPPTSLKNGRQYFLRLASSGIPHYGVVTHLTLEKSKSQGGFDYGKVTLAAGARLDHAAQEKVKAYRDAMLPALSRVSIDRADVDG